MKPVYSLGQDIKADSNGSINVIIDMPMSVAKKLKKDKRVCVTSSCHQCGYIGKTEVPFPVGHVDKTCAKCGRKGHLAFHGEAA